MSAAWALAVLFEEECEEFDKTLPGVEVAGEWRPLPGYLSDCQRHAAKTWRRYSDAARCRGVEPREVRREINRMRLPPRPHEVEAARRILGI